MKIPSPQNDWPETVRCAYNYFIMGSTDEPPSRLIHSETWPKRNEKIFYLFRHQYRERLNKTIRAIRKCAPAPARLLDIGGAQGAIAVPLARLGYQVTINDLRADVFDFVDLIEEEGTPLQRMVGDIFTVSCPLPYDIVFAGEVIEHVAHPDRFLKRCGELTSPGGHVVITTPNGNWIRNRLRRFSDFTESERVGLEAGQFKPDSDGHIFALQRDEIKALTQAAGLVLTKIEYLTPTVRIERMPLGRQIVRTPFFDRYLNAGVLFVAKKPA
jgi:2-polyprenyl-3-methyl-5-hydroxy-6-metoxy-1,4-benzoquinol methylase